MANLRALDKRRKSIKNIRKITRTMELIATARFKKAMDRARRGDRLHRAYYGHRTRLGQVGCQRFTSVARRSRCTKSADLLVLTSNRGLCGGYNGAVVRVALQRRTELSQQLSSSVQVSGKRGISALKFRGIAIEKSYTEFEDQPSFDAVAKIADHLMDRFISGQLDRVDIAYTKFLSASKQIALSKRFCL